MRSTGRRRRWRPDSSSAPTGGSPTVRRQLGFELHATEPRTMGAGMLVDGADRWPESDMVIGSEGDSNFLVFPQGGGRARLYLFYDVRDRRRLAGAEKQQVFLDAFRLKSFPAGEIFASATPAGPVRRVPDERHVGGPARDRRRGARRRRRRSQRPTHRRGAVGRDARRAFGQRHAARGDDWSPAAFAGYIEERAERMRRLRFFADVVTTTERGVRRRVRSSVDAGPTSGS